MKAKSIIIKVMSIAALSSTSAIAQNENEAAMTFFVTSTVHSGNLGGLDGADAICQSLATGAGSANRTWRAYLSTHGTRTEPAVNARDRIGNGPWHNAKGVLIAATVADLHGDIQRDSNLIVQGTALTEKAETINGRVRPEGTNNEHDMLTGSDSHGRAFSPGASRRHNLTCDNWTNDSSDSSAMVGHHDRASSWNTSWNSSHASAGCSLENFQKTGGAGRFYCFATD